MIERFGIRVIAIAAFVVIAVLGLSVWQCTQARQKAAQATQDAKSADAYAGAATKAVDAVAGRDRAENDVDAVVEAAIKEIDHATDPKAARAAVIAATCRLPEFRDDANCAMWRADPKNVESGR